MTTDIKGDSSISTHQKILEEEQVRVDHVMDVLRICCNIVAIGRGHG